MDNVKELIAEIITEMGIEKQYQKYLADAETTKNAKKIELLAGKIDRLTKIVNSICNETGVNIG